jgi:hypothetical protein
MGLMSTQTSPSQKFHKITYPSLHTTRPELSAQGKISLNTGSGSGVGVEATKYFAKAGASWIAILGRRE